MNNSKKVNEKWSKKDHKKVYSRSDRAITLIALIVTIIILLILAGVTINLAVNNQGIFNKAKTATRAFKNASENEQTGLDEADREIAKYMPKGASEGGSGSESSGGTSEAGKGSSVEDSIKIGDYINYDPMYLDIAKTQRVDASKLTYTSPTGSGTSHGNGYTSSENNGGQTYTASSDIKWRVLNISNNTVELISEKVIKKDATNQNSGNLVLNGAIGYLYAEQELNEICKIYGYGYGADTSIVTEYNIGGPLDTVTTNTINQSGARSITVDDVNVLANISSYTGETNQSRTYVYYPTVNTADGISTSTATGLGGAFYNYESSEISNSNIQSLLFNEKYFLASRYKVMTNVANFGVQIASNDGVGVEYSFRGRSANWNSNESREITAFIRPIVTINSNVIDTSNVIQNNGVNVYGLK